jgi:two-component system, NarL family, sensor kinase
VIPAIPSSMLVALLVVGITWCLCGAALLVLRWNQLAAWVVTLTGIALVAGSVLDATEHEATAWRLLTLAVALGLPVSLVTYPLVRWRHPVEFVALVVIVASGALMVLRADHLPTLGGLGTVTFVTLIGHTWWRIEHAVGRERWALQWMALTAGSVALVTGLLAFAFEGRLQGAAPTLLFGLVAAALYLGTALPQIVDVRGLVVSVVVSTAVLLSYAALFVALASLLELVAGPGVSIGSLALLGALAALFVRPLQIALRTAVDEILFGHRPDPLDAASRVVSQFGGDISAALQAICDALVLPYAALRCDDHEVAAAGEIVTHTRSILLEGTAAELVFGLRPGDLTLCRDDTRVLRIVAPMLEQTLRAHALATQVQESREALVGAVAEERRRLRRELHDELGPRLSGIAFTSDAARNLIRLDPPAAEQLLTTLRSQTVTAIDEIRQLVYAMRPPAIDELGLVGAVRQRAEPLRNAAGEHVGVAVSAPDTLPALSAAVEVAVYRIVTEALTNIARHTTSPTATVALEPAESDLVVVITDTGGPAIAWRPGVGVNSMRERAAEVGGTLTTRATFTGGRVEARLPLLT